MKVCAEKLEMMSEREAGVTVGYSDACFMQRDFLHPWDDATTVSTVTCMVFLILSGQKAPVFLYIFLSSLIFYHKTCGFFMV